MLKLNRIYGILCVFIISCQPFNATASGAQGKETKKLIGRIEACTHFAGEDGYDKERSEFIAKQINELRCDHVICDYNRAQKSADKKDKIALDQAIKVLYENKKDFFEEFENSDCPDPNQPQ